VPTDPARAEVTRGQVDADPSSVSMIELGLDCRWRSNAHVKRTGNATARSGWPHAKRMCAMYHACMAATTLQIRNVPEEIHAAVRVRAAEAGISVSDYLLQLVAETVSRPSMADILARARQLARAGGGAKRADVAAAIRAGRDR
jgi:plasmid stability protein